VFFPKGLAGGEKQAESIGEEKMEEIENPWTKENLKEITYIDKYGKETIGHIAKCDEKAIDLSKKTPLQFKYLPQPYMGDPEQAEIFLLNGNPDAKPKPGILTHKQFNEKYKEVILDSLEHNITDYPLYALNPEYIGYYISYWWRNFLHSLIENESNLDEEETEKKEEENFKNISKKLFDAEYFPYFSDEKKDMYESIHIPIPRPKKNHKTQYLESQEYTFYLIEKAIERNKMIVIMRFEDEWCEAVKSLKEYRKKIFKDGDNKEYIRVSVLNSYRNPRFSEKQMTPDIIKHPERKLSEGNFKRILKILKGETL